MTCSICPAAITERIGNHRLCRNCHRERYGIPAYERRKARAAAARASGAKRTCPKCTRSKLGKEFYASGSYCKVCQKAYAAAKRIGGKPTIYLIGCSVTGLTKIGWTKGNIERRLTDLQVGSPTRLHLVDALEGTRTTEKAVHAHFNAARVHGEWFDLSEAELDEARAMIKSKTARSSKGAAAA